MAEVKTLLPKSFTERVRNIYSSDSVSIDSIKKLIPTPLKIRNQGMIVCCECGVINSDSLKSCKKCNQDLIYIREDE